MSTDVIYPLFYEKVKQAPDALAILEEGRRLSRAELDALIDTIGERFVKRFLRDCLN